MKELKINYSYKNDYLHVIVEGQESLQNSISYWIDIIEEAKIKKQNKILIEKRLNGTLTKSNTFRLIKEILKLDYKHVRKIALVDLEQDHSGANEFGASLMLQKGLNIMIFKTKENVLTWLKP